jgi:hypothetical protein
LDALRGFGNAQVPLCAAMAFALLYQRINQINIRKDYLFD